MSLLDAALGEGREWSRVGDCYEVTRKPRGLDRSSLSEVPFAAMEDIPQGGAYLPAFKTKSTGAITSGTYFERGDLLVGKITPSFENGKQAWVHELKSEFGYATTEVIPLHPRTDEHDARVLFFYLLHPDIRHYAAERMEGSTGRQRVPEGVLLDLPYPWLTRKDQEAVADALETVQLAIAGERKGQESAQALKRATMHTLFTRGLRGESQKETEIGPVPESWEVEPLGTHFSAASGGTPSRAKSAYWEGGTIPWVKTSEVDYRVIHTTEERITEDGLASSAAKRFPPGTLLLAMYGQGVTRGKVGILGVEAACNQACAAIQPQHGVVDIKYLYHFLTYRYEALRQLAHGGQQQNLNLDIVRGFHIAYPLDSEDRRAIVAVFDAIDGKIDLHHRKRAVLEELFQALLHKLMTGEIRVGELDLAALEAGAPAGAGAG